MKHLPPERCRLLHAAIAVCALALLLSPLAARSARGLPRGVASSLSFAQLAPPPVETPFPKIYIERDPFAAPPSLAQTSQRQQTRATVRAIASGSKAAALIEEDGRTRLVSVGDRVDGSVVSAIDAKGIVLLDGARIRIEELQP